MSNNSVLLLLGAAGAFYFYSKYNAGKNLQVKLDGVQFGSLQVGQPLQLTANFTLTNPTQASLTLNSLQGKISINSVVVSNVLSQAPATVPAMTEISYPVNFTIAVASFTDDIISVIQGTETDLDVSFQGAINVAGFSIPINQGININLLPAS
jgi:LEA14-like dessication related protein